VDWPNNLLSKAYHLMAFPNDIYWPDGQPLMNGNALVTNAEECCCGGGYTDYPCSNCPDPNRTPSQVICTFSGLSFTNRLCFTMYDQFLGSTPRWFHSVIMPDGAKVLSQPSGNRCAWTLTETGTGLAVAGLKCDQPPPSSGYQCSTKYELYRHQGGLRLDVYLETQLDGLYAGLFMLVERSGYLIAPVPHPSAPCSGVASFSNFMSDPTRNSFGVGYLSEPYIAVGGTVTITPVE
jgi:hypothetical protein